MTPFQMKDARRLLGWSTIRLGMESNTSGGVVIMFERTGHMQAPVHWAPMVDRLAAIGDALESAGIEFIDGDPPSVRLIKAS